MSDPLPGLIVLAIGGWFSPPLLLLTIKFVAAFRVLLILMFPLPKSLHPILQPQTLLIPGRV